jgi:hypothetical protein
MGIWSGMGVQLSKNSNGECVTFNGLDGEPIFEPGMCYVQQIGWRAHFCTETKN